MDNAAFVNYLKHRGLNDEAAAKQLTIAEHLDTLLSVRRHWDFKSCSAKAARTLIDCLVQSGEDSASNIYAILRYGVVFHNPGVYEEALKALGQSDVFDEAAV